MPKQRELNYPGSYWLPERKKYYRFSENDILVVRPWPKPQAWFKLNGGEWLAGQPHIDFREATEFETYNRTLTTDTQRQNWIKSQPMGAALASIPKEVRDAAEGRHLSGQSWNTLVLLGRCPGSLDLFRNAPLIGALLANANRVRPVPVQRPLRSARALLSQADGWKRWKRICRWLDLEDSKAFIRMMRKVEAGAHGYHWMEIKSLLNTWASPTGRKRLSHMPTIRPGHCQLLTLANFNLPPEEAIRVLSLDLFDEIATGTNFMGSLALLDLVRLWEAAWNQRPLPVLRSLEHIETLRAETFERARERLVPEGVDLESLPFPEAPFQGNDSITPLASEHMLQQESRQMNHCIGNASWTRLARMRQGYGYHISHGGEKATLWIARTASKRPDFQIEQIKGPSNEPPSAQLQRFVAGWFASQRAWVDYRHNNGSRPVGSELPDLSPEWKTAPIPALLHSFADWADEIPF